MTERIEEWSLTRETIGDDRLSVIMCGRTDDGSDAAVTAVSDIFREHRIPVEIICVPSVGGPGAALRAAFARATGRYILTLEGDLVSRAALTPRFFAALKRRVADVVVGSKRHPESIVNYPWHRRAASALYFAAVRLLLGVSLSDTESGMMLWRRETLGDALGRMLVKSNAFALELLSISRAQGAVVAEAPVVALDASFGVLNLKTIRRVLHDTFAIIYRQRILGYYAKAMVAPAQAERPFVSVVIPCPQSTWMLEECLAAMSRQTYANWECLVLPDEVGPSEKGEGSGDERTEEDGKFRFIPTGKIRPAEKRNLGLRAAKGSIIAFIDDDAYPDSHWLECAVRYFADPDIGAVGGPGVTPPGDTRLARLGGRVFDNFLVSGNYRYRYKAGGVRRDVDDYPSCNLFVRKDLLDRIGGYRTDFWPGEDTLLCKDIVDLWKRIVYDPWIVVYHHRRPLFLPHLRQLGRYGFHRGYFCKRFPSNSFRLSYFVPTAFVAYLLALVGAAFVLSPFGMIFAVAPLAFYLLLVLVTTWALNPLDWLVTAAGVVLSHLWYGFQFLRGICARRAPCEYIGADHATATVDESKKGLGDEN